MPYTKNNWQTGEVIEAARLNHAEDGIAAANEKDSLSKLADVQISDAVVGDTLRYDGSRWTNVTTQKVTGTTPVINALAGMRYVCGEVTTLDITLPESGIVDVIFESGATPTVLTITPPTGVTLRWANGFDPTSLEANTTYEINIADGLGVAGSWT